MLPVQKLSAVSWFPVFIFIFFMTGGDIGGIQDVAAQNTTTKYSCFVQCASIQRRIPILIAPIKISVTLITTDGDVIKLDIKNLGEIKKFLEVGKKIHVLFPGIIVNNLLKLSGAAFAALYKANTQIILINIKASCVISYARVIADIAELLKPLFQCLPLPSVSVIALDTACELALEVVGNLKVNTIALVNPFSPISAPGSILLKGDIQAINKLILTTDEGSCKYENTPYAGTNLNWVVPISRWVFMTIDPNELSVLTEKCIHKDLCRKAATLYIGIKLFKNCLITLKCKPVAYKPFLDSSVPTCNVLNVTTFKQTPLLKPGYYYIQIHTTFSSKVVISEELKQLAEELFQGLPKSCDLFSGLNTKEIKELLQKLCFPDFTILIGKPKNELIVDVDLDVNADIDLQLLLNFNVIMNGLQGLIVSLLQVLLELSSFLFPKNTCMIA